MGDSSGTNNVDESKPVAEYIFPGPEEKDFDDDIAKEEREYYQNKYKDLTQINKEKLHCTSCDKHLGSMPKQDGRMRMHPMLRTLVCRACHKFYNSGEFEQGDDGSELYCRWCGQGGQVYCCSSCPVVFCAKCVKRNFGASKVAEIENSDDWNCFKCEPKDVWDLRALCWALLRYCDMKNKLAHMTQDVKLKERYAEECGIDESLCCKRKSISNKKKKIEDVKNENHTPTARKKTTVVEPRNDTPPSKPNLTISPVNKTNTIVPQHTISVKKFAMEMGENKLSPLPSTGLNEKPKRAVKRPASPTNANMPGGPVKIYTGPVPAKKVKNAHIINPPVKITKGKQQANKQYSPIAPRPFNGQPVVRYPQHHQHPTYPLQQNYPNAKPRFPSHQTNYPGGPRYNNQMTFANDNINLSLESLTQGLDMSSMVSAGSSSSAGTNFGINYPPSVGVEDELLCTPDLMEPICEVLEEGVDDDVECITPDVTPTPRPPAAPTAPPVSVSRLAAAVHNYTPDNIVQMTDQDVTVNKETGGLKFKVDPQTLSSHKMYRLPDGRIFAINVNPNMPGGYSATIVALAPENLQNSLRSPSTPNRVTFPAKVTSVVSKDPPPLTSVPRILNSALMGSSNGKKNSQSTPKAKPFIPKKAIKEKPTEQNSPKQKDMTTSVEWLRYNLIDAVDLMEYVLKRLKKMDSNAQISELRTKSVDEMKVLHRQLDQLLKTSATRFTEVRSNLDEGLKEWLQKKGELDTEEQYEDDDDVEILSDDGRDEPIFIDENSNDSISTYDQPPKILSTQSINISDETNNAASIASSVDPLSLLYVHTEKDSSGTNDKLLKDHTTLKTTTDVFNQSLNELGATTNIRSQIFLEDADKEDNVNVNVCSDTSVRETDAQKPAETVDEKNNSKNSDDKALDDLNSEETKSADEEINSVNEDNTLIDEELKSDQDCEMSEKSETVKDKLVVALEVVSEDSNFLDEKSTLADGETKSVGDVKASTNGPESSDEEMKSADREPELVNEDETSAVNGTKLVDEVKKSADEEPKADEDGIVSKKPELTEEIIVASQVVSDKEHSDEDNIPPEEETDIGEDSLKENLDEKITEAEEDELLSSKNDEPDTNAKPNGNEDTNEIKKKDNVAAKEAGRSGEKVDSDVPISDELINNLLATNDSGNLRSELEKFAEGALDAVDFVEPEFV